jgi:predicted amidohydrolase
MDKIRVGVCQLKPTLGNIDKNLAIVENYIARAMEKHVQLLVLPELGLTGYHLRDMVPVVAMHDAHPVIQRMLEYSRDISIAFGYAEESADHKFYNSSLYVEEGRIIHRHRKVYLPTYGMFDELRYFASGDSIAAFDTKFGRIGTLICEDVWHLSAGCILSADGADIMLHLASSPARGMKPEPRMDVYDIWENLNRMYATAFCCYVVFANRVGCEDGVTFWGGSEVIDPDGEVAAKARYLDEEVLITDIDPEKIRRAQMYTPVRRDEDIDLTLRELRRIIVKRENRGNE